MARGLLEALVAAVAFGVAALLQAVAARREGSGGALDLRLLARMLRDPAFLGAIALNLTGFGLHFSALRSLPLFLAQSIISSSVVVTALLSSRVLQAPLRRAERGAVAAVVVGLVLVAGAAGRTGSSQTSVGWRAGLLVAMAGVVVVGLVAGRVRGAAGALVLGAVAGVGFALVSISARVLPDFAPATLVVDPATYALVVSGVTAFMLYSAAFQRGSALSATAAMVLGQTAVPSLVGVLLLGDTVRPGFVAVLLLGVVAAAGGAVALARFDPASLGSEPAATERV